MRRGASFVAPAVLVLLRALPGCLGERASLARELIYLTPRAGLVRGRSQHSGRGVPGGVAGNATLEGNSLAEGAGGAAAGSSAASGVAARLALVSAAVDQFLATPAIVAECASLRRMRLVRGVEDLGVPLELRFRHFVLRSALREAVQDDPFRDAKQAPPPSLLQSSLGLDGVTAFEGEEDLEHEAGQADLESVETGKVGALGKQHDHSAPPRLDDHGDQGDPGAPSEYWCSRRWTNDQLRLAGIPIHNEGAVEYRAGFEALSGYCNISSAVMEVHREDEADANISHLDTANMTLQQNGSITGLAPVVGHSKPGWELVKRNIRRLQALQRASWFLQVGECHTKVSKVRGVFMLILQAQADLDALEKLIGQGEKVDWGTVEAEETSMVYKIGKGMRKFFQYAKQTTKSIGKALYAPVRAAWRTFRRALERSERKCEDMTSKVSNYSANRAGLPQAHSNAEQMAQLEDRQLQAEAAKIDGALKEVEDEYRRGLTSRGDLEENMRRVKADMEKVQRGASEGDLGDMDDATETVAKAEQHVCKEEAASGSSGMRETIANAMRAMEDGFHNFLPSLGTRGVAVTLGVRGGLEQVVDFVNREVGLFRYGSVFVGSSGLSAGFGGYAGMGYKGYKYNWTLQEAIQTGIWLDTSVGVAVPGLKAGLGVTVGTDADDTLGAWSVDPAGVNVLSFGYSWVTDPLLTLLPASVTFDVGISKYHLLNTECYPDVQSLIRRIWFSRCEGCYQPDEQNGVQLMEAGIRALSWPIITESIFTLLALLNERRRKVQHGPYNNRCSDLSTNLRDNVTNLAMQSAQALFDSVERLEKVEPRFDNLEQEMESNEDVPYSAEFHKWMKESKGSSRYMDLCPQSPSELQTDDLANGVELLQGKDEDWLDATCVSMGLRCRFLRSAKQKMVRIALARGLQNSTLSTTDMKDMFQTGTQAQLESVKLTLLGLQTACGDRRGECAPAWDVVKELQKESVKSLWRWCSLLKLSCHDGDSSQILAMKIVRSRSTRLQERVSTDNPFGTCDADHQCFESNTACELGPHGRQRCQCAEGFCYSSGEAEGRPGLCKDGGTKGDERHKKSIAKDKFLAAVRRSFASLRVQLGLLIHRLNAVRALSC